MIVAVLSGFLVIFSGIPLLTVVCESETDQIEDTAQLRTLESEDRCYDREIFPRVLYSKGKSVRCPKVEKQMFDLWTQILTFG